MARKRQMPKKRTGLANRGNRELWDAMQEKRRSSAASPHDPRPNRERSRSAVLRAEIRRDTE